MDTVYLPQTAGTVSLRVLQVGPRNKEDPLMPRDSLFFFSATSGRLGHTANLASYTTDQTQQHSQYDTHV